MTAIAAFKNFCESEKKLDKIDFEKIEGGNSTDSQYLYD